MGLFYRPCDLYVKSMAHHEAGYLVIAVSLGLPLRERGMHIDEDGEGVSYYKGLPSDCSTNAAREAAIIAAGAGVPAQKLVYEKCELAASHDDVQINSLLNAMYPEHSKPWCHAKTRLRQESERLVANHQPAINALAKALWAVPWAPQTEATRWSVLGGREKWLSGQQVAELLQPFGRGPVVCEA